MTEKDFKIERIQDGSFRVTRTDIKGDYHSHMLSNDWQRRLFIMYAITKYR